MYVCIMYGQIIVVLGDNMQLKTSLVFSQDVQFIIAHNFSRTNNI